MKLILLFFVAISLSPLAAGPSAPAHWYAITITVGNGMEKLTGSSTLDSTQMGASIVRGDAAISLENLRDGELFDGKTLSWRAVDSVTHVSIIPRSIVYFAELPGDPLTIRTDSAQRTENK